MSTPSIAKNNFLVGLATFFLSLATIFFFSQIHAWHENSTNQVDGHWYTQMKGFPVAYAGFSISDQQVPWYFLRIKNVINPSTDQTNQNSTNSPRQMYVYFDLRLAVPVFVVIFIIIGTPLFLKNYIAQKNNVSLFYFDFLMLIIGIATAIFFYFFSVPWN